MRNPFLVVLAFILGPLIAMAQEKRQISPRIYRNYIDRNAAVKIQTIEAGRVSSTDTGKLDTARVRVDQKTVVSYDQKIVGIDKESFQKLNPGSLPFTAEEIKVIPELHVETPAGQAEALAYRIVFTLQQPLEYSEALRKFNARLGFFLLPESGSNAAIKESINIEVVANEAQSVKPASFPITHLNLPSSNVELIAEHVNDSTVVKVITASRPRRIHHLS